MTTTRPELTALSRGFRQKYLDHAALTAQLEAWAAAFPDLTRLVSLGRSPEGRELWLLEVGRDLESRRPAAWVDGNMHASELCGSSVALAIAEDVLALHLGETRHGLAAALRETLLDSHFYILPRLSPDGAEAVLRSGRYVRSSPFDERPNKGHAYWRFQDVDGDGRIGYMRQRSPDGDRVELPGYPGVLVPRLPEDEGPFYRVYPEGVIENFDGHRVPDPAMLSDNAHDFNRNFPWAWAPEPRQAGAGEYPGCMPETRAVLDFASRHPNIFTWLNLHTFGGVLIRPLGHAPDSRMDAGDLAIYRQVEAWAKEHTSYPTVSGFQEFLYEPEKPLQGDLTDYAYHQRGALAYVVELWDIFRRIGMEVKKPFIDHYSHLDRRDFAALARFDREVNAGRIFRPWRAVEHPQLGTVEVGGYQGLVGISNPPYELLDEVCQGQSAAYLRVAALLPRLEVQVVRQEALGGDLTRVELRVTNRGYLATYGVPSARALPHSEELRLEVLGGGVRVESPTARLVELGHLEGWGLGLHGGTSIFAPWSRGNANERWVSLIVKGQGELGLKVGSCRVGYWQLTVPIG